ncbi:MAG: LysM peptidoglycan-binding domain-containing protein [Chloroflexi bacterium]|nr:LysM peptidoglycan-binding domain-containing protein [Chloroflexota bacterium]
MQWKRLTLYLLINVVVSAITTIIVLTLWERAHQNEFDRATAQVVMPTVAPTEDVRPLEPTLMPTIPLQAHQVRSGETLGDIALEYDVTVEELMEINGLTDADALGTGQVVYVPEQGTASASDETPPTPVPDQGSSPSEGQIEIVSVVGVGDLNTERLVLGEAGGGKHALAGWQLHDEDGNVYTFPQATLYENGQIVINTRVGLDNPLELYWGLSDPVWGSGEFATLYDATGQPQAIYQIP